MVYNHTSEKQIIYIFYMMSFFYKIRLIKVKNTIKQHVILFLHVKNDTSQQKLV